MPLMSLVVMLIVVGVGLYLINRYTPMAGGINMAGGIKGILNVVVLVVCVWLLQVTGLWGSGSSFRLTR